jgi:hypothetical protein
MVGESLGTRAVSCPLLQLWVGDEATRASGRMRIGSLPPPPRTSATFRIRLHMSRPGI